jgi:hypothetical protein
VIGMASLAIAILFLCRALDLPWVVEGGILVLIYCVVGIWIGPLRPAAVRAVFDSLRR